MNTPPSSSGCAEGAKPGDAAYKALLQDRRVKPGDDA
jgi:hypothetical protein